MTSPNICSTPKQKTGTREWAEHNENCIEGCKNDCLYCYGAQSAERYGRRAREVWHIMKPNARSGRAVSHYKGRVMFPTTHDLHIEYVNWWGPFLQKLLEMGNDVLIVTKPEYQAVSHICQVFAQYKNQIEFRFTIGTNDHAVAAYWEPNAPTPTERFIAILYAHQQGFRTSISMEPLLMEQPKDLIVKHFSDIVTGEIWIGAMNHYPLNPKIPEEAQQIKIQSRENMQRVYESLKDNPQIRWKDSVQRLLGITDTGEVKIKRVSP